MSTPVFATDVKDLAIAFKTLCEADELTNMNTYDERKAVLYAIQETVEKYRSQLKEESKERTSMNTKNML